MARLTRLNLPNVLQHIVQRGNSRQVTFVEVDDYVVYLEKLKCYAKEIHGVRSCIGKINGVRSCIVHL